MPKMSQHIQHHHPQHPQYVHYAGPSTASPSAHPYMQNVNMMQAQPQPMHHILHYQPQGSPGDMHQQQNQQAQSTQPTSSAAPSGSGATGPGTNGSNGPLVAQGDWTKDLVHLAKQAELNLVNRASSLRFSRRESFSAPIEKHALALQLHTAHILSAHASLEQKSKAIQDIKEQKNKLESERARLLKCLQDINADRDSADLAESTLNKECTDLRTKISQLSDGEYALAKNDVDRLRADLGQAPLPSLQQTLEERTAQYLTERRLGGNEDAYYSGGGGGGGGGGGDGAGTKRGAPSDSGFGEGLAKRPRGRPKGSKNKKVTST
ncbi:hypothetical protein D9611_008271 [Ephemerocybe angulata]|uniref:Uncharacterized protein n=1 Tax=Ephemerocybe angulata TaxID=980116 RepID=A0A8H5BJA6_9AGAR|nr:hypothetical protein D9611_008271 [Tulosesus angulatus]